MSPERPIQTWAKRIFLQLHIFSANLPVRVRCGFDSTATSIVPL